MSRALFRSNQDYDAQCQISLKGLEELWWWINHLTEWNGKSLMRGQSPDIVIESDASLIGWGATSTSEYGRLVECTGETLAYELLGDRSSQAGSSVLSKESDKHVSVASVGQHNSSGLHKSPGWYICLLKVKELWLRCLRQRIY